MFNRGRRLFEECKNEIDFFSGGCQTVFQLFTRGEFVLNIRGKPSHLLVGIFSLFLSFKMIKYSNTGAIPMAIQICFK